MEATGWSNKFIPLDEFFRPVDDCQNLLYLTVIMLCMCKHLEVLAIRLWLPSLYLWNRSTLIPTSEESHEMQICRAGLKCASTVCLQSRSFSHWKTGCFSASHHNGMSFLVRHMSGSHCREWVCRAWLSLQLIWCGPFSPKRIACSKTIIYPGCWHVLKNGTHFVLNATWLLQAQ